MRNPKKFGLAEFGTAGPLPTYSLDFYPINRKAERNMGKLVNRSKTFLKQNAPTILTCIGGVGVVATSVMAVKATPKALQRIDEAKEEKGESLTKLETVKVAGPVYIPAVLTGVATLTCIFGANALNKRQQASLASAYALLSRSYNEYRSKVDELHGEGTHEQVTAEIAKDKYEDTDITVAEDKQLFFDQFSGRYFESTIEDVQRAEYRVNRDLVMRDYVSLNEFYEHLGIPKIDAGESLGWSNGGNFAAYWQTWIDFSHQKTLIDDDLECYIIHLQTEPTADYTEYW